MFDQKHYIPILKWKAAEQQALEKLSVEEKEIISPLIQLVMPNPKSPKKGEGEKTREEQLQEVIVSFKGKMKTIPEDILKSWGKDPAFIDFSLIYTPSLRMDGLNQILKIGEGLGLVLIPVVNLSSNDEIKKLTSELGVKYKRGLCLRLVSADFINPTKLFQELLSFLATYAISERNIDLLIDLKEDKNNEYSKVLELSQQIPHLTRWRTFSFGSGAFPVDLTNCRVGEKNYIARLDWNNWINHITSRKLKRHPAFADYTIQHPIYKESVRFFSPSASIRYTLQDKWLVMRGQKGKPSQYLANARLLSELPDFFGEHFSFGDAQIKAKGINLKSSKTGNATTWLVASINHHLAVVVSQIANLS